MISSDLSSQVTVLQVDGLAMGGPDEGVRLLVDEVAGLRRCAQSTSIRRNRWWPRSIFS